jgi:hypothetical protein
VALTVLCLAFWLGLDLLARSDSLLVPFRPQNFLLSLAAMLLFSATAAALLGLVLWLGEGALLRWPRYRPGNLTLMALYGLLIYVNVLYCRNYCAVFDVVDIARARWAFVAAFLFGLALYKLRFAVELEWLRDQGPRYARLVLRLAAVPLLLALAVLAWAAGQRRSDAPKPPAGTPPHIVIVTCDAMRRQSMSVYGYSRPTTPNLDKLAQSSYVFERFHANCNGTEFAMPAFKVHDEATAGTADLLLSLQKLGYRNDTFISFSALTAPFRVGFSDVVLVRSRINHPALVGLRDLFGVAATSWLAPFLSEPSFFFNIASPYSPVFLDQADRLPPVDSFRLALDRLRQARSPIVVWVHLYQPHFPYYIGNRPPFGNQMLDRYDAAILMADDGVGRFIESLKTLGLWDSCLFVLSADHGEAVGEKVRGRPLFTHGADWCNELVADIPLLIHLPGQSRQVRVASPACEADLAPTLLAVLKAPADPAFPGESLEPYMRAPLTISDKVKLCVPKSHWVRRDKVIDPKRLPEGWISPNMEEFIAYRGRYEVRWVQAYRLEPGKIVSKPDQIIYTAVYDVFNDPARRRNLYDAKRPEIRDLIAAIEADAAVQATR